MARPARVLGPLPQPLRLPHLRPWRGSAVSDLGRQRALGRPPRPRHLRPASPRVLHCRLRMCCACVVLLKHVLVNACSVHWISRVWCRSSRAYVAVACMLHDCMTARDSSPPLCLARSCVWFRYKRWIPIIWRDVFCGKPSDHWCLCHQCIRLQPCEYVTALYNRHDHLSCLTSVPSTCSCVLLFLPRTASKPLTTTTAFPSFGAFGAAPAPATGFGRQSSVPAVTCAVDVRCCTYRVFVCEQASQALVQPRQLPPPSRAGARLMQ